MTKTLPWTGRFALFLFLPAGILPFFYSSDQHSRLVRNPTTRTASVAAQRTPSFTDWTNRHALYSRSGTSGAIEAARRDPRAAMRWREREQFALNQRIERGAAVFWNRRTP